MDMPRGKKTKRDEKGVLTEGMEYHGDDHEFKRHRPPPRIDMDAAMQFLGLKRHDPRREMRKSPTPDML